MLTLVASGNWYPRDIGRSSVLGDAILFQFGDTFSHNADGDFINLASNTAAVASDKNNPTLTRYMDPTVSKYTGSTEETAPEFIKLSKQEAESKQWKIWSYSGTVEYHNFGNGSAAGWTWYQMRQKNNHSDPNSEEDWVLKWIGLARVKYNHNGRRSIQATRVG